MKYKFFIFFLFTNFCLFGQWNDLKEPKGATNAKFYESSRGVWATTNNGLFLFDASSDAWERIPLLNNSDFLECSTPLVISNDSLYVSLFLNGKRYLARSYNAGVSWETEEIVTSFYISGAFNYLFKHKGILFISTFGKTYSSNDEGENWVLFDSNFTKWAYNESYILSFQQAIPDHIRYSDDAGVTWKSFSISDPNFQFLKIYPDNEIIYNTLSNTYSTKNFGVTWNQYENLSINFGKFAFSEDKVNFLSDSELWESFNRGKSFSKVSDISNNAPQFHIKNENIWMCSNSLPQYSNDGGRTWEIKSEGIHASIICSFFNFDSKIYAQGYENVWFSDDGLDWNPVTNNLKNIIRCFTDVCPTSSGLYFRDPSVLQYYSFGLDSIISYSSLSSDFKICKVNNDTAYLLNKNDIIVFDNGFPLDTFSLPHSFVRDIIVINDSIFVLSQDSFHIDILEAGSIKSLSGSPIPQPAFFNFHLAIYFYNNTLLLEYRASTIFHSSDFGKNWSESNFDQGQKLFELFFGDSVIYAQNYLDQTMNISQDNGKSWRVEPELELPTWYLNDLGFFNNSLFGGLASAGIWKSDFTTNIKKTGNLSIDNYYLKVAPNPTSDFIQLTLPIENSNISITNELGQLVLAQKLSSGKQMLDVSFLPSGLYFIVAESNNQHLNGKFMKH